MLNVLTAQGLIAAQQMRSREFTPFGDARPSYDYVKRGDVIRVNVIWQRANDWFVFDMQPIYLAFRNALGQAFNVLAVSPSENWTPGGTIVVDLQTRSDYARLNDVVSVVAHDAQTAGLSVDAAQTRGEFVSKVEDTSGNVPSSIPAPGSTVNKLESFIDNLTQSPLSLAVIAGAAVILIIAAKR